MPFQISSIIKIIRNIYVFNIRKKTKWHDHRNALMGETIEGCCHGGEYTCCTRTEFGFCHKFEVTHQPDSASSSFVEHHRNAFQNKKLQTKKKKNMK